MRFLRSTVPWEHSACELEMICNLFCDDVFYTGTVSYEFARRFVFSDQPSLGSTPLVSPQQWAANCVGCTSGRSVFELVSFRCTVPVQTCCLRLLKCRTQNCRWNRRRNNVRVNLNPRCRLFPLSWIRCSRSCTIGDDVQSETIELASLSAQKERGERRSYRSLWNPLPLEWCVGTSQVRWCPSQKTLPNSCCRGCQCKRVGEVLGRMWCCCCLGSRTSPLHSFL